MRRRISAVLALTLLVGLTGACGSDDDKAADADASTTTTEAAEAEPTPVAIAFDGKAVTVTPASVPAGLIEVSFTNTGKAPAEATLAKLDAGKTIDDVKAYDAAHKDDESPPPPFVKLGGGPSATPGGKPGSYTAAVEAANYVVAVFAEDSNNQGVFGSFEVSGGKGGAELPKTEAKIQATEYSYTITGLKAGENEITLRNSGGLPHIFVLFPLKPDAKLDDVLAAGEGSNGPPPGSAGPPHDLSYLDPGHAGILKTELAAGKYGIVCFLDFAPGGKTGKPHFQLGMKQEFTVA